MCHVTVRLLLPGARQAHGAAQTMRWHGKGGAIAEWHRALGNVATGETSPGTMQGPAGKVGVEWSLDSHRAAREPGNGVGRRK